MGVVIAMTIGEALEALRAHWGAVFIDYRPGVSVVSDTSSARRVSSLPGARPPRVFEAATLQAALTVALNAEGLGVACRANSGASDE